MFAALDVIIVLVFVFASASACVTATTQVVVDLLGWRNKQLRDWIEEQHLGGLMELPVLKGSKDAESLSRELFVLAATTASKGQVEAAGLKDLGSADIGRWFDESMRRLSARFTKRVRMAKTLISLGLCALLNVDALAIAKVVWSDEMIRASLVERAEEAVVHGEPGSTETSSTETSSTEPVVAPDTHSLPIGWNGQRVDVIADLPTKVLGIVFSGLACSLGAPFWFELLSGFVVMRRRVRVGVDSAKDRE